MQLKLFTILLDPQMQSVYLTILAKIVAEYPETDISQLKDIAICRFKKVIELNKLLIHENPIIADMTSEEIMEYTAEMVEKLKESMSEVNLDTLFTQPDKKTMN